MFVLIEQYMVESYELLKMAFEITHTCNLVVLLEHISTCDDSNTVFPLLNTRDLFIS